MCSVLDLRQGRFRQSIKQSESHPLSFDSFSQTRVGCDLYQNFRDLSHKFWCDSSPAPQTHPLIHSHSAIVHNEYILREAK